MRSVVVYGILLCMAAISPSNIEAQSKGSRNAAPEFRVSPHLTFPDKKEYDHRYSFKAQYDRFTDSLDVRVQIPLGGRGGLRGLRSLVTTVPDLAARFVAVGEPPIEPPTHVDLEFILSEIAGGIDPASTQPIRLQLLIDDETRLSFDLPFRERDDGLKTRDIYGLEIPVYRFLQLANATTVEGRYDDKTFELSDRELAALKDFASRMSPANWPPSVALEDYIDLAEYRKRSSEPDSEEIQNRVPTSIVLLDLSTAASAFEEFVLAPEFGGEGSIRAVIADSSDLAQSLQAALDIGQNVILVTLTDNDRVVQSALGGVRPGVLPDDRICIGLVGLAPAAAQHALREIDPGKLLSIGIVEAEYGNEITESYLQGEPAERLAATLHGTSQLLYDRGCRGSASVALDDQMKGASDQAVETAQQGAIAWTDANQEAPRNQELIEQLIGAWGDMEALGMKSYLRLEDFGYAALGGDSDYIDPVEVRWAIDASSSPAKIAFFPSRGTEPFAVGTIEMVGPHQVSVMLPLKGFTGNDDHTVLMRRVSDEVAARIEERRLDRALKLHQFRF